MLLAASILNGKFKLQRSTVSVSISELRTATSGYRAAVSGSRLPTPLSLTVFLSALRRVTQLKSFAFDQPTLLRDSALQHKLAAFHRALKMSDHEDVVDGEPPAIDPYEVLGLERTATADQVKSAYRKAALKNHPGGLLRERSGGVVTRHC